MANPIKGSFYNAAFGFMKFWFKLSIRCYLSIPKNPPAGRGRNAPPATDNASATPAA